MKYFLFSFLVLVSLRLYSQSEKKIDPPAGNFSGGTFSASASGIKLLHFFADSSTLGYIPAEKGNETYKLVSANKNKFWLDTLVGQRYNKHFVSSGKQLLWLVRELSLTADTAGQYYFIRIKADVYSGNAARSYQKLFMVDTILTGRLVDNDYSSGIADALDELYQSSLSSLTKKEQNTIHSQTEDSIVLLTLEEKKLPILKDNRMNRGAYATFQEFLHNTPSITNPIWAEPDTTTENGVVKLFMLAEDSSIHQLTSIWGACFGENELYKYEKGQLIPIEKSGNGFILSRYQDPVARKNQALYWRRIATRGRLNDTNPFSKKQTVTLKVVQGIKKQALKNQPIATRIDMSTGELTF